MFTKANIQSGQNVLITGIGGGVAITALQYAVALGPSSPPVSTFPSRAPIPPLMLILASIFQGANVWVSSSSEDKIARAVSLGAKGGINYKSATWPKELAALLPSTRPYLDAVIDSGGGPIMNQVTKVLKYGGVVVCYGSTSGVDVQVGMGAILKNLEFKGAFRIS